MMALLRIREYNKMMQHTGKQYNNFITRQRRNLLLAVLITVIVVFTATTLVPNLHPKISTEPKPSREQFGRPGYSTMTPPITVVETRDNETSAATSSWSVLTPSISVGRPLHILLTTRDRRGNRRTRGGDFFTAVLRSDGTKSLSASSSGEVEDFLNGSYLITFVPHWSGPTTVHIKLWLTSRAIKIVKRTISPNLIYLCAFGHTDGVHVDYIGQPERRTLLPKLIAALKAKRNDAGLCQMNWQPELPRSNTSCSMSFPNHYHWYGICEGPRSRHSTSCDSLQYCVFDDAMRNNNMREQVIINENTGVVPGAGKPVIISKGDDNGVETVSKVPCQPQPYVRASGYWMGQKWINRDCSFHCNSTDKWWKCLSGRNLHFIGDSTIRQLFHLLLSSVNVAVPQIFVASKSGANRFVKKYNATIHYTMHGPPVMTSLTVNFSGAPHSADLIDAIPGNENEILVLSMIHHFIVLPPEGFQLRIQQIIAAIRRLRQRNMGKKIPIVFRTANPRDSKSFLINTYRVKWYNQLAKEALMASNLGVIVYDIFDMVAACLNPETVHQAQHVMSVQLDHILSLTC